MMIFQKNIKSFTMMQKDSIFTKIIKREIPASIIYESNDVISFLDIAPINKGHSLVVPKELHVSLSTIPKHILAEMIDVARKIGTILSRTKKWDGYNLHLNNGECAGQVVHHSHIHVIPRVGDDQFCFNWRSLSYSSEKEKEEIAQGIREKLNE